MDDSTKRKISELTHSQFGHQSHASLENDWSKQFEEFHQTYPEVYNLFKFYALQLLDSGRTRYGARSIIERIRWHHAVGGGIDSKINNMYIAYYARMLIQDDPRFASFFNLRRMQGEEASTCSSAA